MLADFLEVLLVLRTPCDAFIYWNSSHCLPIVRVSAVIVEVDDECIFFVVQIVALIPVALMSVEVDDQHFCDAIKLS